MKYIDKVYQLAWEVEEGLAPVGTRRLIHTIDRGTAESMKRQAKNLRQDLQKRLDNGWNLDQFLVDAVRSPDPLGGWEVFVEYWGQAASPQWRGRWRKQRFKNRPSRAT